jgi:hypothetical protein
VRRVEVGVEPVAEEDHRLGPELADAGLGDSHVLGDVRDGAVLEEDLLDDLAQALGERGDGRVEVAQALVREERLLGTDLAGGEHLGERTVVALEGQDARGGVLAGRVDLGDLDAEGGGDLLAARRAAELRGELVGHRGELAHPLAGSAGDPVHRAELVDHGALDADRCVAVERHTRRRVVGPCGLDESEGAGRGQVVAGHVARDAHEHLADVVPDQREVLGDQL